MKQEMINAAVQTKAREFNYCKWQNHLHRMDLTVAGLNGVHVPRRERKQIIEKKKHRNMIPYLCI